MMTEAHSVRTDAKHKILVIDDGKDAYEVLVNQSG